MIGQAFEPRGQTADGAIGRAHQALADRRDSSFEAEIEAIHCARTKDNPLGQPGVELALNRLRRADAHLGKRLDELAGRLQCVLTPENVGRGIPCEQAADAAPLQAEIDSLAQIVEIRVAGVEMLLRRLAL